MRFSEHLWIMENTYREAEKAFQLGEVPVAAIITDSEGREVLRAHNLKEKNQDASAHAEIIALRELAKKNSSWRLNNFNLYVNLEPCPMCMSAISQFRISKLIFGAYDPKGGAISLGYNIHKDQRLNHQFEVIGGIMQYKNSKLISEFFKIRR